MPLQGLGWRSPCDKQLALGYPVPLAPRSLCPTCGSHLHLHTLVNKHAQFPCVVVQRDLSIQQGAAAALICNRAVQQGEPDGYQQAPAI